MLAETSTVPNATYRVAVVALVAMLAGVAPAAAARAHARPRAMTMTATAYCLRGITADGSTVHRGTIAADPRVLPLGSRIRIRGGHLRGTYVVEDNGAAVKGRRIDIYMPRCEDAKRFGRQRVAVTVERIGAPVRTTR